MSTRVTASVLLVYEDSDRSERSISTVAELFPGACVFVLCMFDCVSYDAPSYHDALKRAAVGLAQAGAAEAARCGLRAEPVTARYFGSPDAASAIGRVAADVGAGVIVASSRRRGRLWVLSRGGTPDALVRDARVPVLLVPSR